MLFFFLQTITLSKLSKILSNLFLQLLRHINLRPFLPENEDVEPEMDYLSCVDSKLMTLVKTIKVKQFTAEMCREYCDMQSFPVAVYEGLEGISGLYSCSCSPTLIDTFRARTSCPNQ